MISTEALFNKNVDTLQEFGFLFPFEYEQFVKKQRCIKNHMLSIYSNADNELLI